MKKLTKSECAKLGGLALHKKYNLSGENNPNWRGGIANVDRYRYKKAHKLKHPEKVRAREAVHRAVKSGKLIKEPCVKCGNKVSFAHHTNYLKPLKVLWLCRKHHQLEH